MPVCRLLPQRRPPPRSFGGALLRSRAGGRERYRWPSWFCGLPARPAPVEPGACCREKNRVASCPPSLLRRLLDEWLASRGKSYKRPPMTFLAKRAKRTPEEKPSLNRSFWRRMEEEEEARTQRLLASEISSTLAECLALAKEVGLGAAELGGVLRDQACRILGGSHAILGGGLVVGGTPWRRNHGCVAFASL